MSNTEDNGRPDRDALADLESAVKVVLEQLADATERASEAEATSAELQEIVKRFTGDEGEAGRLLTRLNELESENDDLKRRLQTGRAGIDRLLAKIRFLEEQR